MDGRVVEEGMEKVSSLFSANRHLAYSDSCCASTYVTTLSQSLALAMMSISDSLR